MHTSGSQIAVQAFGLDVNAVEAVFFTQGQVLQNGVARAEAVALVLGHESHDEKRVLAFHAQQEL